MFGEREGRALKRRKTRKKEGTEGRRMVGACIPHLIEVRLSSVGSKPGARDPPILIQLVLTRP